MLSNFITSILNNRLIIKQNCQLCGQPSSQNGLCPPCYTSLPALRQPACPICAQHAGSAIAPCGQCLRHPPAFDVLYAAAAYDYPLDSLIIACKYGKHATLQGTLAQLMKNIPARLVTTPEIDLVIPLPLASARLAERGFNLPDALARTVAATINSRFNDQLCVRKRNTAQQATLNRQQRLRNMHDAFSVNHRCDGLCIAIVDDVATTGATLDSLARSLKKAGAKRVEAWVLARAFDHKI